VESTLAEALRIDHVAVRRRCKLLAVVPWYVGARDESGSRLGDAITAVCEKDPLISRRDSYY